LRRDNEPTMRWDVPLACLAIACLLTPLWYPLYRHVLARFGYPKKKRNGEVRRMNLFDWLNATGIGMFGGTFLAGLAQWIRSQ
jgi:hypothetical protein